MGKRLGVLNTAIISRIQPLLISFKDQVETLPFSETDAVCVAQIRSILKKEGRPTGPYDILLDGMSKNRSLVTDNTFEFWRVEGILIENWLKKH